MKRSYKLTGDLIRDDSITVSLLHLLCCCCFVHRPSLGGLRQLRTGRSAAVKNPETLITKCLSRRRPAGGQGRRIANGAGQSDFQLSAGNQQAADCSNVDVWDHDFYNCCRKSRFDFDEICDPCCRKPYVSFFGGATTVEDFFREITTATAPLTLERQGANLVDGYGLGAAIGYRVHNYLRIEAEYSYRFNKVEDWFTGIETDGALTSLTQEPATGRIYSHAGMFNMIADLSQRRVRCFNLHAGAGLGILTVDAEVTTATNTYISDDSQFAYQLIGGVTYPWSDRLEFFSEYRYLSSDGLDVVDAATGAAFGDFGYDSHNLFFGLRINR